MVRLLGSALSGRESVRELRRFVFGNAQSIVYLSMLTHLCLMVTGRTSLVRKNWGVMRATAGRWMTC